MHAWCTHAARLPRLFPFALANRVAFWKIEADCLACDFVGFFAQAKKK
jgi:hypothetical protein